MSAQDGRKQYRKPSLLFALLILVPPLGAVLYCALLVTGAWLYSQLFIPPSPEKWLGFDFLITQSFIFSIIFLIPVAMVAYLAMFLQSRFTRWPLLTMQLSAASLAAIIAMLTRPDLAMMLHIYIRGVSMVWPHWRRMFDTADPAFFLSLAYAAATFAATFYILWANGRGGAAAASENFEIQQDGMLGADTMAYKYRDRNYQFSFIYEYYPVLHPEKCEALDIHFMLSKKSRGLLPTRIPASDMERIERNIRAHLVGEYGKDVPTLKITFTWTFEDEH